MNEYIAHVRKDTNEEWLIHSLDEHLSGVNKMASFFSSKFHSSDWAEAASLLHDLGKGSDDFQKYIDVKSGYNNLDVHIEETPGKVTHSTHGAVWAFQNWGEHIGKFWRTSLLGITVDFRIGINSFSVAG